MRRLLPALALFGCQLFLDADATDLLEAGHCADATDNDGDNLLDCADTDCAADLACAGTCGDAVVDAEEECDDGNTQSGDGCQANCTLPVDIAVSNEFGRTVSFFQSDASGSFSKLVDLPTIDTPTQIAFADLNEDALPDLLVPAFDQSHIRVFLGQGGGSFSPSQTFAVGAKPLAIVIKDLNGDSHLDLICSNFAGSSVTQLFGDGTGNLGGRVDTTVGLAPNFLSFVDTDRDGADDHLFVNNRDSASVSALLLGPTGELTPGVELPLPNSAESFTVADFNNDNNLDLAAALPAGNVVVLLLARDLSVLSSPTVDVGAAVFSVSALELTQDQTPELILFRDGPPSISIRRNDGAGQFLQELTSFSTPGVGLHHTLADVNADNAPDLLTTNPFSAATDDTFSIFLSSQGAFGAPLTLTSDNAPRFIVVGRLLQ